MDCGAIAAAILALSSQTGETYECADSEAGLGNEIDFETWLALEGARYGLPTSLDAFNADWETWLASR